MIPQVLFQNEEVDVRSWENAIDRVEHQNQTLRIDVVDENGRRSVAMLVPMKEWEGIEHALENGDFT